MDALKLNIRGIKCDNQECDFMQNGVEYKDYPAWLNKPCPKCGANLLTQEDLDAVKILIQAVDLINFVTKPLLPDTESIRPVKFTAEMNGTGTVNFKLVEPEGKEA
jgi:hypothetical protein